MQNNHYHTLVVGLGAMGSAAVYHLAQLGVSVLGIDQYHPPHVHGSSHGQTRIIRQGLGEGEQYIPLVQRSYQLWHELEARTQQQLLYPVGGLVMAREKEQELNHFLEKTIAGARKYEIKHQLLESSDLQKRFPQFQITAQDRAYYEPEAGYLIPEKCIEVSLQLAEAAGAVLHFDETVQHWQEEGDGLISVTTDHGQYTAEKVIISAGAGVSDLLGGAYQQLFQVYQQTLYWFAVEPEWRSSYAAAQMPVFIWEYGNQEADFVYGFPMIPGMTPGLKIATEQYQHRQWQVDAKDFYQEYVQELFPGVTDECLVTASCHYTATPDRDFVVDVLPGSEQVLVVSPCSGHGFKHSAAIGEAVATWAVSGEVSTLVKPFSLNRLVG